jgi:hypothetical protein
VFNVIVILSDIMPNILNASFMPSALCWLSSLYWVSLCWVSEMLPLCWVHYAECHCYTECHYADCLQYFLYSECITLNVIIIISVIMLSVPNASFMLSGLCCMSSLSWVSLCWVLWHQFKWSTLTGFAIIICSSTDFCPIPHNELSSWL